MLVALGGLEGLDVGDGVGGEFAAAADGAGDDAAGGEGRSVEAPEADDGAFDGFDRGVGDVGNDDALLDGEAEFVGSKSGGEAGERGELLSGQAADGDADAEGR